MGISLYPKITADHVIFDDGANAYDEFISEFKTGTLSLDVYPIGSIYQSVLECNPAELFGGEWVQIQACFLFGADPEESSMEGVEGLYNFPVNTRGGVNFITLTVDNIPKHAHDIPFFANDTPNPVADDSGHFSHFNGVYGKGQTAAQACKDMGVSETREIWWSAQTNNAEGDETSYLTSSKGTGKSFNNVPPYLSINVWKRVA